MNAIIGFSELARREYGTPEGLEHIADIKSAGNSLLEIINAILDFSKIESGQMTINVAPYETAPLLGDILTLTRIRIEEKSIMLLTDIASSVPCAMTGDAGRIRQILLNLLNNAIKYTERGFIQLAVSGERLGESSVRLTMAVADSGIGIKPEAMPKVFDKFTRVDEEYNSAVEGTGLGLTITRSLCQAMGGDIAVASEYGKGSSFTVTLTQIVDDWSPIKAKKGTAIRDTKSATATFTAPDFRVLVVDDIVMNLKVAEGLLSTYKMRIDTCLSGKQAVALVQERDYDLVLMDHMMPEMDGIEAVAAIRALGGRFAALPIVALTANAVSGMRELFLENGFTDFLAKPIEVAQLDATLKNWIPEEKRQDALIEEESESAPDEETMPEIPGVDVAAGMVRTGGSRSRYLELLATLRRDMGERLPLLEKPPDDAGLHLFVVQVHALKSALAGIGALSLSQTAALLEDAGRRQDMALIRETLGVFRDDLARLAERIDGLAEAGDFAEDGADAAEAIGTLRDALDTKDVDAMDAALARLQALPLSGKTRRIVSDLADHILMADFKKAVETVTALLERKS
jgi:CheY-like chemotaxis protein